MARIERSIFISAPPEKVFDVGRHPEKFPEWLVGLSQASPVSGEVGPGASFNWTYEMAGLKFEGRMTYVEFEPGRKLVLKGEGGIESTWTWTYQPQEGGTLVTCVVEYTVPGAALGKIADKLIVERTNTKNLEKSLQNLKARVEGG